MRHTFPCGHKGKGQHCHRCAQEAAAAKFECGAKAERVVRSVKTRDALALLMSAGFEHVRTRGSHATYRHPDGRIMGVVVNHLGADVDYRALLELRRLGVLGET